MHHWKCINLSLEQLTSYHSKCRIGRSYLQHNMLTLCKNIVNRDIVQELLRIANQKNLAHEQKSISK